MSDAGHFWPTADDERLRAGWLGGELTKTLASELGVTPSALWSRARRLGLPRRAYVRAPVKQKPAPVIGARPPKRNAWLKDRDDVVIAGWMAGKSATEIAVELSTENKVVTRNAVIGRIGRLRELGVKLEGRTRHGGVSGIAHKITRKPPTERKIRAAFEPGQKPPGFVGIPFLNLEPWQCRYPYGEGAKMLFCGKRKMEESSYCPDCHSVCHGYVKEPSKRFTPAQIMARAA